MTRLAFGAKCSFGNAPAVLRSSPAHASSARSDARAAAPMPVAVRPKNWRRVWSNWYGVMSNHFPKDKYGSVPRHHFVEVQDRVGDHRPGGYVDRVELLVPRGLAHFQQLLRRRPVLGEPGALGLIDALQDGRLLV